MLAYVFLGRGATSVFDGRRWPVPAAAPGEWVSGRVESADAVRGYGVADLPFWLDDELWVVELDGDLRRDGHMVRASRGRLHRRVDGWDADAASEMALACANRARDAAADALRRAGRAEDAERLAGAMDPAEIEDAARDIAAAASGTAGDVAAYVADAYFSATNSTTPGAAAAVTAYISARAGACAHASGDYTRSIARERAWQASWLRGRIIGEVPF
jgi:hypothetical protein